MDVAGDDVQVDGAKVWTISFAPPRPSSTPHLPPPKPTPPRVARFPDVGEVSVGYPRAMSVPAVVWLAVGLATVVILVAMLLGLVKQVKRLAGSVLEFQRAVQPELRSIQQEAESAQRKADHLQHERAARQEERLTRPKRRGRR